MFFYSEAESNTVDPYFSNVSLLIKADGEDNSTTFVDSSNNFAISRIGNTKISTDQSKFGGSSVYFDGNGDYLTAADTVAFNFGTGNFTVECWVYLPSLGSGYRTFCTTAGPNDFQGFYFGHNGGQLVFLVGGGSRWDVAIENGSISANTWTHVCGVRNGNVFTTYINGVQAGSQTLSIMLTNTNNLISVGGRSNATQWTNGYIDDLRVTKGIARYTANFTPPDAL